MSMATHTSIEYFRDLTIEELLETAEHLKEANRTNGRK